MWADGAKPFHGKHYQLAEPLNHPQPLSKPHPPILVGGAGEKKTLRLVAQYADACNLFAARSEELRRKLDILKGHCDAVGRDYNAIEKTTLGFVAGPDGVMTTSQMVAMCRSLAAQGIQHLILSFPNGEEMKLIPSIGREVIPAVAEL
jgi:alkanesulfonate monooxygenase